MTFATINAGHKAFERDKRDSRRALRDCNKWAKATAAQLQAEWDALPDVPRTIEQHLAGRAL